MLYLENQLLKYMNIGNKEEAFDIYEQMFEKLNQLGICNNYCIRNSRNFLISLNAVISRNYYNRPICKQMLYHIRLEFAKKIEFSRSVDELCQLGKDIIIYYIENIEEKNILTRNPNINRALEYIQNNLHRDITLDEVANNVYISSTYLSHLFTKCIGMTFSQYVVNARIDKSKNLLANTSHSVMDIALECGFNSQSYFSNVFKKLVNVTPKEYRMEFKKTF